MGTDTGGRRTLTLSLPSFGGFILVLLLVGAVVLVVLDREQWNWYSEDPRETATAIETLENEVDDLRRDLARLRDGSTSSIFTSSVSLEDRTERIASLLTVMFAAFAVDRGLATQSGAEALANRCKDWLLNGGDFESNCR